MSGALAAAWGWWQGQWPQVYPNLIAGALQGGIAVLWARRHVRRLHVRLDRMHHRLTELKKEGHGPQGH